MATIKSYTDLSQSKTLSKILPLESADMSYMSYDSHITLCPYVKMINDGFDKNEVIPCWSLAALLGVLPYGYSSIITKSFNGKDYYCKIDGETFETEADNPVDACYELILELHELNLL